MLLSPKMEYGDVFSYGGQGGTRKRDYARVQEIAMKLPFKSVLSCAGPMTE